MRRLEIAIAGLLLPLLGASFQAAAEPDAISPPPLSLTHAVHQALDANLDLLARRSALAADRDEIDIVRSSLLPQAQFRARAQILDDDRSDDYRGNTSQKSVTVGAGVTQVLYDETSWADFAIQKHVYAEQREQLESFRLGVVRDAADAFLELDRDGALVTVRERNRELTRRNLETSRARVVAGWSSERETLRWESQLAENDRAVVEARTQQLLSRFELNRVRNRSVEDAVDPRPVGIDEYGFVYAREKIAKAIAVPEGDRRLRDFLVRVGLDRSPVLAGFDAAIAAEERLLTANKRSFWIPSVSLGAGVDHLAARSRTDGQSARANDTEWTVGAGLDFPLLEGGGRFAELHQTRENISSLRFQRRAAVENLSQGIRSAFAQASGSYTNLGFARIQQNVAGRNYELVNDSYVLGVASILSLLDAQSQLLNADLALTNALYDFLEDLVAAEEQMAFFPFLQPEADVRDLLDRLEARLTVTSTP